MLNDSRGPEQYHSLQSLDGVLVPSLSIDRTETIQDRRLRLVQAGNRNTAFGTRRFAFLDCLFAIRRGLLDRRTMMARQGDEWRVNHSEPAGPKPNEISTTNLVTLLRPLGAPRLRLIRNDARHSSGFKSLMPIVAYPPARCLMIRRISDSASLIGAAWRQLVLAGPKGVLRVGRGGRHFRSQLQRNRMLCFSGGRS